MVKAQREHPNSSAHACGCMSCSVIVPVALSALRGALVFTFSASALNVDLLDGLGFLDAAGAQVAV